MNDTKTLKIFPMMPGMTYVVDRDYGGYYSLGQRGSVFVGRMMINACYEVIEELSASDEGTVSDDLVQLSAIKSKKGCSITLRLTQVSGCSTLSLQKIARLVRFNLTSRRSILALLNPSLAKSRTQSQSERRMTFDLSFA